MNEKNEFKPYIPADKVTPEFTITSIVMGILLAVVFGAANAYLGLRVGMTVSASIPAAVISMGVIRVIMRKNSILESNLVQTIGSAGESLAAGAIFTLPALFLWAAEGKMNKPSIIEITIIALIGGLLGVLFMIPLRNALIVKEHGVLPYPEGTACAEVLLAGEEGGANASTVFAGLGIAAVSVGNFQMAAIVVVNALGEIFSPQNGQKIAGLKTPDRSGFLDSVHELYRFKTPHDQFTGNTTIGAVITKGAFSKAELNKIASMTRCAYARCINPVATMADGDSIYAASIGVVCVDIIMSGSLAAEVMAQAIQNAIHTSLIQDEEFLKYV